MATSRNHKSGDYEVRSKGANLRAYGVARQFAFAEADASRLHRIATLGRSFRRRFERILSTFTKLVVEQIWERVREFLASPQASEFGPNLPFRGNPPRRRSRRCRHFSVSEKPPGITQVMGVRGAR